MSLVSKGCLILTVLFCGLFGGGAAAVQTVSQPFLGVKLYQQTETSPRPLNINVLEIDLSAPGISFLVTPRGPAPQPVFNGVPDETVIQTPRQFLNASGAQIAINASFYAISELHTVNGQTWTNNLGLTASKGDAYSPWQPPPNNDNNYDAALNITAANQASILKMPSSVPTGFETNPAGVSLYNTITGKNRLLENGVLRAPSSCGSFCDVNPRTAVGLTSVNSKLLLMTIDGRRAGFSEGVTLVELAGYMADYGATNAINLDGGGSTQMAVNYYSDGASAQLVNVPSEAERRVGTSLAVYALPNGDYDQNGVVDLRDYVVWRNSIGGQYAYDAWRQRYGSAAGSGSGSTEPAQVPEPAVQILIAAATLCARSARCA
jgi:exopolysaccharide biosynthesis protein